MKHINIPILVLLIAIPMVKNIIDADSLECPRMLSTECSFDAQAKRWTHMPADTAKQRNGQIHWRAVDSLITKYQDSVKKYSTKRKIRLAKSRIYMLRRIIDRIPSCLSYEGSLVTISYEPESLKRYVHFLRNHGRWFIDIGDINAFQPGKILIIGATNTETTIPANSIWGKGSFMISGGAVQADPGSSFAVPDSL